MEMILRTSGLATLRDQATLFVLSAPDQLADLPAIAQAIEKGSLPNIQKSDLPVVWQCEFLIIPQPAMFLIATQQAKPNHTACFRFPTGLCLPTPRLYAGACTGW